MSHFSTILKQADIFYELTPTQLELIADLCSEKVYEAGDIIFLEGANNDELYIITRGEVDIQVNPSMVGAQAPDKNFPVTITTLRRGQSFGEIALVDEGFRSATARAAQNNTQVLILPRQRLIKLCDTYPQLGYLLMRNLAVDLALKIRSTDLRIREELLYGSHTKSR
jgi:CRP/FNR family transcriptional regulator, cyclic AMP receptor protein